MVKLLVVIALVALVLWLLFGRSRTRSSESAPPPRRNSAEGMVACAHCGVHLPGSEALRLGERAYCSAAHRDAGARP